MEEKILSLEKGAMERWRNGDPWGWAEICADNIIYLDPSLTKPIIGIEGYKSFLVQIEGKIHYPGSEFIDPMVTVVGDAAVLSYNYRSSLEDPEGNPSSQTLWNATEVYFLQEGSYRIAHTHWSFVHQKLPDQLEVPIPVQMSPEEYEGALGELMTLESAGMERWRKGDPQGFLEICAPEVTYFDAGTDRRVTGLAALTAVYEPLQGKISFDVMEFVDPRVQVHGEAAVLNYRFFSTRLNKDGSISRRMPWNCTEVYARKGEGWRIIHTHWSYIQGQKADV
jgi:hypothetical protein